MIGLSADHNRVSGLIVDAALEVHRALGPGLLESVYEQCLAHELGRRQLDVVRQLTLPVRYKDLCLEGGFRIDLLVDSLVIVKVKAVERLAPVHEAQLLTYLKLARKRLGLLVNFNVALLKHGLRRVAL